MVPRVSARSLGPVPLPLWVRVVIVLCCVIEAALMLSDLTGFRLRAWSTILGGFWSPLAWGGTGAYSGQGLVMFVTYGFLHGGLLHLAMNMISFAALARELGRMIGAWNIAVIYAVSQVVAAVTFALMAPDAGPMVGASGAVFGLAGAVVGFAAVTLRRRRQSTGPLWRGVGLVLGLNIALTLLMPAIAWQAHLGGGLIGLVMGAWVGVPVARRAKT